MRKYIIVILLFLPLLVHAQKNNVKSLDTSMVKFFTGKWSGSGKFVNGKDISADISVTLSLDSAWLEVDHTDKAPNHYKAKSFWGVNRSTGEFVAYTLDNFQGHRQFTSSGWKDNKLILTTQEYYTGYGTVYQHFIYEKLSPDSFKMTYETSLDAINWKLGDSLVFKRN